MADIRTTTGLVADAIKIAYDKAFEIEATQARILHPFATKKFDVVGKSIEFSRYGKLPVATTPLSETADPERKGITPSKVTVTPAEYGDWVGATNLASIQTVGEIDEAIVKLVADQYARTMDTLALNALLSGSNVDTGTFSGTELAAMRTRLAMKHVPMIGGAYVALANEETIDVIRGESDWKDVTVYNDPMANLLSVVGFYKGHRIVSHSAVTTGTVISFGQNALGYGESQAPGMKFIPQPDLRESVNVGWYGVLKYQLIDNDAVEIFTL